MCKSIRLDFSGDKAIIFRFSYESLLQEVLCWTISLYLVRIIVTVNMRENIQ